MMEREFVCIICPNSCRISVEYEGANIKNIKGHECPKGKEYVKNEKPQKPYEIEAITGATISSRAVVNILNKGISDLKKDLSE